MAVQFSPRDVNFVLVDFKGTSLLQPFRALPHLAGSISNLDRDIRRCLLALDNEMERRQILVDRCEAHDILGYQALRRKHPEMEEMPFLFLVIDEFADFKAQFPDFTGPAQPHFPRRARAWHLHRHHDAEALRRGDGADGGKRHLPLVPARGLGERQPRDDRLRRRSLSETPGARLCEDRHRAAGTGTALLLRRAVLPGGNAEEGPRPPYRA